MKNQKQNGQKNLACEFKLDETPYWYPKDKNIIFDQLRNRECFFIKKDKQLGCQYAYNVAASFDIETSSFRQHVEGETKDEYEAGGKKFAVMYVWQFSINGRVILGRTWNEFINLIKELHNTFNLSPWKRLIVYVHNLSYEFSFIRKYFRWCNVFASSEREPIYAITMNGIEFRDSYILTGKSLANCAKDLVKYKVKKLVGDLDYELVRGPETPLTHEEIEYCIHDDLVVDAIIQEKIEQEENGIAGIPLTNTGYVRRFIRKMCFANNSYHDLMNVLTVNADMYEELKEAFAGGFTHANAIYVNKTLEGKIDSFDFTSSYPAVILSEKFPMSAGKKISVNSIDDLNKYVDNYCCLFRIKFYNIREKSCVYDNPISYSKCRNVKNGVLNNGRVVKAESLETTLTDVDFKVIKNFYDYDSFQVADFIIYDKGYLPKPIIQAVLELYKGKTMLKGIEDSKVEYQVKKGMLNSTYGCMVTDIVMDVVTYNDDWEVECANVEESINQYNTSKNRFLYYPWGVWVTAYARRNLFSGILEFGEDYIYSDTDSIKCFNADNHMEYINEYNKLITHKVETVLKHYDIDAREASPKTVKGVEKPIGVWDWETETNAYTKFKTCGAKRYMYTQYDKNKKCDEIHITIAGLGKAIGGKYIASKENPYEFFNDGMMIPPEYTGKMTHTYIDEEFTVTFVDYRGEEFTTTEKSAVHLEKVGYSLSETSEFIDYIKGIQKDYRMKGAKQCKSIIALIA